MSYRIRFTLPDGRTGLWPPIYATREEAQRIIRERLPDTWLAYSVEEVATPEARIRELERELSAMSLRLDGLALLGNRLHEVLALELACYEPTNPRLPMLSKRLRDWESVRDRMEFEREGKPNVIEAELAQLRDAYDAARQDLDVAERKVARLESTLAMVQASWAVSVANADVARAASAEAHRKAVVSVVRLDRALELGDAMHRAHPSEEWAEYKDALAALRRGPAKASGEPMEKP